jgi:hypothetical protein
MAQTKKPASVKAPAPKAAAPKQPVKPDPVIIEKKAETPAPTPAPAAEKPKVTEPRELSPEEKWNTLKPILLRSFPGLHPGELDIINCTVDDMRAHVEGSLRMTKYQIRQIIPEY